jgi:hypothetical protein
VKKIPTVISILAIYTFSYASLDIEREVGVTSDNKDNLWNSSIPYAVARQGLRSVSDREYIVSFLSVGDHIFGLSMLRGC